MSIFSKTFNTNETHSATIWGSGALNVLSTPTLTAFMENTAFVYVEGALDLGQTTVGIDVHIQHLAATKIGNPVNVHITKCERHHKKIYFELSAYENDKLIGTCKHTRFIVDIDRFLSKLS